MSTQKNEPRALALGVAVYIIWGFFPLYFSLLSPAGAVEVIVHRAVWGLFFCLVALAVTRSLGKVRALIADRGALWRLAVAGALTMIPLIMFASAARGLTLGTMGFLQYLGPTLQLLVAVFIFHETVPMFRWIAMGVVWVALACLSADWLLSSVRAKRLARAAHRD